MLIGIPIDTYEQSITVSMLFVLSFPSEIAHTTFDSGSCLSCLSVNQHTL
jgi:hypothetical protein